MRRNTPNPPAVARRIAVDPAAPDPAVIAAAAAVLRRGGLVAFPTETVYGLGADALDPAAVARIFAAKGRPAHDPLIVHVLDAAGAAQVAAILPPAAVRLAAAFWPGPLTLVVPRGRAVPDAVSAGLDSVAVRAPAHPVARALIAAAGVPIAAPSANRFGHTSPTTAGHVMADLAGRVDLVLDGGPADIGVESTVVDCLVDPPAVLRPGGVTLEALREVIPAIRSSAPELRAAAMEAAAADAGGGEAPSGAETPPLRAPGLLARHYAPRARLVLVRGADADVVDALAAAAERLVAAGRTVGLLLAAEDAAPRSAAGAPGRPETGPGRPGLVVRRAGPRADAPAVARALFASLRDLDGAGVDVILARDFGTAGLGLAIRDRLTRAAEGRVVAVPPGGAATAAAAVAAAAGLKASG